MALVAYGNSDSSDYEEEDNDSTPVELLNNKTESKIEAVKTSPVPNKQSEESADDGPSLFNLLPQPSTKNPAVIEEDDEFLHKKSEPSAIKPKAKITVPSLNDFKDVEHSIPTTKPRVANGKKSGLLSMLPQPRNGVTTTTRSLIPNVLTKKPSAPVKKTPVPSSSITPKVNSTPLINDYSDDSDNEEVQNDFFSINKPVELPPPEEVPLDIETPQAVPSQPQRRGIEAFFKQDPIVNEVSMDQNDGSTEAEQNSGYVQFSSENLNSHEVPLDEEAIMKLVGSRGKRKREEIQIVDINQEQVLGNSREMLMKGLMDDTTKRVSASKKKGHEPTSQQRRKHQITYLAYQAKANEAELQNQWANNKMSKRQTQSKYGF